MGLMFISCGLYLGFEYKMIFVYLGMGATSLVRGIWIFNQRAQVEKQRHLEALQEAREARDQAAAEKKAKEDQAAAEKRAKEDQPSEDQSAATAQSEPTGDQAATKQETPPEMTAEPAANDSVVVVEPRKREPGEPVQYDPYDSLATRQHK